MTEILNLDKLIANVVKIQVGNEKIDIPINDRNTKLLASYDLSIMGLVSAKDAEVDKWANEMAKDWTEAEKDGKEYKPDMTFVEKLTMQTADEMKAVVFEYTDKIFGEGYAEKFYKHYGESTNALSTILNVVKAEYEKQTTEEKTEKADYYLNREQRRKDKKDKKKKKLTPEESIKSMANMDVEKLAELMKDFAKETKEKE